MHAHPSRPWLFSLALLTSLALIVSYFALCAPAEPPPVTPIGNLRTAPALQAAPLAPPPTIDEFWVSRTSDDTWIIFGHVTPMPSMTGQLVYMARATDVAPFGQYAIGEDGFFFAEELDFGNWSGTVDVWAVDQWGRRSPTQEAEITPPLRL